MDRWGILYILHYMIQNMGISLKDQGLLEFLREALSSINLKVLLMVCDFWYGINEKD